MQKGSEKLYRKQCKRYNHPCHGHALTFSCYHNKPFLLNQAICEKLAESVTNACIRHDFALWAAVFFLLLWNVGCINRVAEKSRSKALGYNEAVEMATEYLRTSGRFDERYEVYHDPENIFWNDYTSSRPGILAHCDLHNRNYYAIIFYIRYVRDGGVMVFIDRDEKRPICLQYGINRYEKIEVEKQ